MNAYLFAVSGMLGLVISMGVIGLILLVYRHVNFNAREEIHHTHHTPVPRYGGIAMAVAFSAVYAFSTIYLENSRQYLGLVLCALAMFALGLWDDIFTMGAKKKLLGQFSIASIAYFSGLSIHQFQIPFTHHIIELGVWAWPVTVFWLVAITNLINLIDGLDGLAGGICLMLMLLLTYVGGQTGIGLIAAGMVGILLGFLRFNFPPAQIYMGDGGAYFLGFLIAGMTIMGSEKGEVFAALIAPLFVLALPILDTSLAIVRRGLRGLPLFRPDRGHIHHRLLETGLSRRRVVLGFYGFTAFFLLIAFVAFWFNGRHLPLLCGVSALAVLGVAGKLDFSRNWLDIGRVIGNSIESRSEIKYAFTLTRWLALEGMRTQSMHDLCEDVAFVARKLGYVSITIRLEDDEKTWKFAEMDEKECHHFQHNYPGNKDCFIKLCAPCQLSDENASKLDSIDPATYRVLSDLLAEGWAKAFRAWKQEHEMPLRFDARLAELQALKAFKPPMPSLD